MIEILCPAPDDTLSLARKLAAIVRPGDVVLLVGSLGSGKTLFTSGLAAGLGVEEQVVSPSFVLVRQYNSGFLPLVHVDVYRLGSINEFDDLDVFELAAEGVLVIEWADAVEPGLPGDFLKVTFDIRDDESRLIGLGLGGDWAKRDIEAVL